MDAYTGFAQVYDLFMDDIDYDRWADYAADLLRDAGADKGIVLDLGCGTGSVTRRLAAKGYDMIGVDRSCDMLSIAMDKGGANDNILYLCQDMREFELYGTVAGVVSTCDALNYLTEYDDLVSVFSLVHNYLDPGGVFVFDMNLARKYARIGDGTIAEDRDEASFIWENSFDSKSRINEYRVTFFVRGEDGRYDKFSETHIQRAYTVEEIIDGLKSAGLKVAAAYDAFSRQPVTEESERACFVARETAKSGG